MVLFVLRAASRGATQIDSARNVYAKPFAFQGKYAITISMALSDWPDSYNFATDTVCQSVFLPFIEGEMAALKAYDAKRPADRTYIFPEHAQRVADLTQKTVLHMGFGETVANNLYWAVLPHDIGKAQLPFEIWDSEEKPDATTKRYRRTHTLLGAQKVDAYFHDIDHPFKDLMADMMRYHHEEMSGNGTLGIEASALPACIRLAAIIEAYDGYRIWRPHFGDRDISPEGVIARMRDEKGADVYDLALLEAFAEVVL